MTQCVRRAQYDIAQKQAMELAAKIDKGGPDKGNEMQVTSYDQSDCR